MTLPLAVLNQGMPRGYDVNLKELEDAFRQLQRHLHPDKFTTKEEAHMICHTHQLLTL